MNEKIMIIDATDDIVIGGFENLDGNLGLLKYNEEQIKDMINENNNHEDNIRLILSLLNSLKELKFQLEESKKLREIIDNVRLYINDMIKTYEQRIEIETDMGFGDECKKIKCYKEFNRKLTNLKKELDVLYIDKGK